MESLHILRNVSNLMADGVERQQRVKVAEPVEVGGPHAALLVTIAGDAARGELHSVALHEVGPRRCRGRGLRSCQLEVLVDEVVQNSGGLSK